MSKAILCLDKMPDCCDECYCYYFAEGKCLVKDKLVDSEGVVNKRPDWCPLIEDPSAEISHIFEQIKPHVEILKKLRVGIISEDEDDGK